MGRWATLPYLWPIVAINLGSERSLTIVQLTSQVATESALNTCPNLKTETRLVDIYTQSRSKHRTRVSRAAEITQNIVSHDVPKADHTARGRFRWLTLNEFLSGVCQG